MNEYRFEEIKEGMTAFFQRQVTLSMEDKFREICGDENPLHMDDAYAREAGEGKFAAHVTFGMLTASFYSTLAGMYLPGKYSLLHSFDELSFLGPVFAGDVLTVEGEVFQTNAALRFIRIKASIKNQDNRIVSKAKIKILVLK